MNQQGTKVEFSFKEICLQQKNTENIIPLVGINIIIWILASKLFVLYRVFFVVFYTIFNRLFNSKQLRLGNELLVYRLPLLKRTIIMSYSNVISARFRRFYLSNNPEYMDLELKYRISRKKEIVMPIPDHKTAMKLYYLFLSKDINVVTNDKDLQKIITKNKLK